MKRPIEVAYEVKHILTIQLSYSTASFSSKINESLHTQKHWKRTSRAAAFTLAQSWAQGNVHLQANRMTTVAHPRDGKQATDTRHNVEEPSKSC